MNNEQNNVNIKNLEELNYSFSAMNKSNENIPKKAKSNINNSNIIQKKRKSNKLKNSLPKGDFRGPIYLKGRNRLSHFWYSKNINTYQYRRKN